MKFAVQKNGSNEVRDRVAEGIIEIYKVITASHGAAGAEELDREIERFRSWPGPKKMPD